MKSGEVEAVAIADDFPGWLNRAKARVDFGGERLRVRNTGYRSPVVDEQRLADLRKDASARRLLLFEREARTIESIR